MFQSFQSFEMRDSRRYLHRVFEAKKRFRLCVINYVMTSNHAHLLVRDSGANVIPQSLQLIAGRTAQEYNQRKTGMERSGRTAIMLPPSRPTSTRTVALCTSI
jgi:REP element-mobilizing transposase RayT